VERSAVGAQFVVEGLAGQVGADEGEAGRRGEVGGDPGEASVGARGAGQHDAS
jgi:hypothetical protein